MSAAEMLAMIGNAHAQSAACIFFLMLPVFGYLLKGSFCSTSSAFMYLYIAMTDCKCDPASRTIFCAFLFMHKEGMRTDSFRESNLEASRLQNTRRKPCRNQGGHERGCNSQHRRCTTAKITNQFATKFLADGPQGWLQEKLVDDVAVLVHGDFLVRL